MAPPEQSDSRPTDGHPARYRYRTEVVLVIAADGLDSAHRVARSVAQTIQAEQDDVISASAHLVDLHHAPDLDGSLRSRRS